MRVAVHPFGSRDWATLWCVVLPRQVSEPFGSSPKQRSPELWCFSCRADHKPLFKAQLDGAKVHSDEWYAELQLLPGVHPVNKAFVRRHDHSVVMHVRPIDSGEEARESFEQLLAVVRCPLGARAQLLSQVLIHRPPDVPAEVAAMLMAQPPPARLRVRSMPPSMPRSSPAGRASTGAWGTPPDTPPGGAGSESTAGVGVCYDDSYQQGDQQQQLDGEGLAGSLAAACSLRQQAPLATCVVCLDAPPQMGLKHGGSVHRCVCYQCAVALVRTGEGHCPLCRQRIEEVLLVY
jgi:hypothetical protein